MDFSDISLQIKDEVGILTIERQNVLNCFNAHTIAEIRAALEECERSQDVRIVVLRGAGDRAFSVGADIHIFQGFKDPIDARRFWKLTGPQIHEFIERMTKPVIAVVRGYCLGGGLELALSCDLIVATEDSKFGFPEVGLGLIPGWGGTQRIARIVGRLKAKELVMLGDWIDAGEAYRLGIVNRMVPADKLEQSTNEIISKLLSKSRIALIYAKEAVNKAYETDLENGLSYETELDTLLISTHDAKEGVNAFLEKRKPKFLGY